MKFFMPCLFPIDNAAVMPVYVEGSYFPPIALSPFIHGSLTLSEEDVDDQLHQYLAQDTGVTSIHRS